MRVNYKNVINIAKVVLSNFTLLLAGIVTSFVLPKIFSLEDYGCYKIYNLYSTYIIVLQFGIVEGIYIKYGGKDLNDIKREEFSGYFKSLLVLQSLFVILVFVFSISLLPDNTKFIGIALAINILIVNITNLFQYLSQAIQRFTELSIRNVVKSVFMLFAVLIMFCLYKLNYFFIGYEIYIIFLTFINIILLIWYIYTYRSISIGNGKIHISEIKNIVKVGFPLCLSNIIASLILSLDRQIVLIFFETNDYAIYSFAYSLLTLISTIVTSVAVVMFSMFKQKEEEIFLISYKKNIGYVSILVSGMGCVYFPLRLFVRHFLPLYISSIPIFRVIIPGLMISCSISIVMHNYYKVLNLNFYFFRKSIAILFLSVISNLVAYYTFGTMESISYASVIIMLIWYLITEKMLKNKYNVSSEKNFCYLLLIMFSFYICSCVEKVILGMFGYIILYSAITCIFYKDIIREMIKK